MQNKKNKLALTGGAVAAEALKQIEIDVMPIYPITPQTTIIETYAGFEANGEVETEMIKVESEHSAMSAAIGASSAGARTATATSSQGLALMHEVLYIASGMRLPIMMLVSARALASPINIHGDHSDVMGCRDSGWIQLFCENGQEVYDKTIIGMKLAEKVKLPIMVIMDGFNTSHSVENLEILETKVVQEFVGEFEAVSPLLDTENPVTYGAVALQNSYFEFRIDQEEAMKSAEEEYEKIAKDFEKISGRKYDIFEEYRLEDAEKIMVITGSASGTAKVVVDKLREAGEKVGILKINLFRPFPHQKIAESLKNSKEIIVLDRAQSIGTYPPFYSEIINSLYGKGRDAKFCVSTGREIKSYVYGLGGRDIFQKQIEDVFAGKIEGGYIK
ncbi:MAG: pyruvate ferredoxin oxidoreductase [Candidatus Moranbacteria bacterium CG23_combo_of_CG06-09_8_20_14_all_35_22]|nr:MAG: pyruvate ferredoxin oxidoreductase [Candidatus Moranbacteria bacterium CG23_combo_of_CG06-09_8_20_14_all_35_22]